MPGAKAVGSCGCPLGQCGVNCRCDQAPATKIYQHYQYPARLGAWGIYLPPIRVNNRSTKRAKLRFEEGRQTQGEPRPGPLGGDPRSVRIEAQEALIKALLEATPDITTEELRAALVEHGHAFGYGSLQRFFRRHALARNKKSGQPTEQDRPDVLKRRQEWFDGQIDLDLERLVFIAETWAKANMARIRGRCPPGERLRMGFPHGQWKTATFVGALAMRGMIAPFVLSRAEML
jgi:hypothetical protein